MNPFGYIHDILRVAGLSEHARARAYAAHAMRAYQDLRAAEDAERPDPLTVLEAAAEYEARMADFADLVYLLAAS